MKFSNFEISPFSGMAHTYGQGVNIIDIWSRDHDVLFGLVNFEGRVFLTRLISSSLESLSIILSLSLDYKLPGTGHVGQISYLANNGEMAVQSPRKEFTCASRRDFPCHPVTFTQLCPCTAW